jgi:hypothetical protein
LPLVALAQVEGGAGAWRVRGARRLWDRVTHYSDW